VPCKKLANEDKAGQSIHTPRLDAKPKSCKEMKDRKSKGEQNLIIVKGKIVLRRKREENRDMETSD